MARRMGLCVCALQWDVLHDKAAWTGGQWLLLDTQQIMSPEYAYASGHRFHSIAEPPAEDSSL
jgi:hypothetical protein